MPLDDHTTMSPAEIEGAIRRADVWWRAWELGLRSDEVAALLARGLEHGGRAPPEHRLHALGARP